MWITTRRGSHYGIRLQPLDRHRVAFVVGKSYIGELGKVTPFCEIRKAVTKQTAFASKATYLLYQTIGAPANSNDDDLHSCLQIPSGSGFG